MYTVTVLTPRGRRQQVKVTPNTTLLQVLEEVCSKHDFNAQEYDLRHHNKVLDISAIFRFTGLPNNAQLEMTEAVKQRQESPVTLGVQFETGERVTGVFSPSENIWHVIISLKPDEEKSENIVVIYMRQEIYGVENLKKTTLRSIGLTSGRAILRVLHRAPDELRVQANVSTVLPSRASVKQKEVSPKATSQTKQEEVSPKGTSPTKQEEVSPKAMSQTKQKNESPKQKTPSPEPVKKKSPSPERSFKESKYSSAQALRGNVFENLLKDIKAKKSLETSETNSERFSHENTEDVSMKDLSEPKPVKETSGLKTLTVIKEDFQDSKVILLGDRNAIAYNLNSIKPLTFEEEPEDFYDLTLQDAKLLLKHAKQLCADLEDAPLMTAAQREFEKDKKVLSLLHQYKKTVIRVKFPDRTVLQGTFAPLETVSAVEKFVSEYLESPRLSFYLYTTPPKEILKSDSRLIECGCVPSCVVYFGMPSNVLPPPQFLKKDVMEKLSTPSAAALHALQSRGLERNQNESTIPEKSDSEKQKWSKPRSNSDAGPSGSQPWDNKRKDNDSSPQFKVPKWFRSNK